MRIDVYTKVILTVIAVALVLPQFTVQKVRICGNDWLDSSVVSCAAVIRVDDPSSEYPFRGLLMTADSRTHK